MQPDAHSPEPGVMYLNREISWLAFNERVLEEAADPLNPLLERFRFLTIYHTNLDEFFMIRISGLLQQVAAGIEVLSADGQSPQQQLSRVRQRVQDLNARANRLLLDDLLPALADQGVQIVSYSSLTAAERSRWESWYGRRVHPILTPLAVGPTAPFPFISNLSLNLALWVQAPDGEARLARVKLPLGSLPRLIHLDDGTGEPGSPMRLLPIEELISANIGSLFPGMVHSRPWTFRVTRDADFEIKEDEADDLMESIQLELRRRRFGQALRLEIQNGAPARLLDGILDGLSLNVESVQEVAGPVGVPQLNAILKVDRPDLKYAPFKPNRPPHLVGEDVFSTIRAGDVLVHHPFDAFTPVLEFLRAAAADPHVVAIKQTLYRTSGRSPIIAALEDAIENGKQVAAVVELKARFDEENNIVWAQRLEAAGVHVIYGVPLLKTHAKLCMVVRQEGDELVRYCHIGTGNYNATTARVYTDLGLFTARPEIATDVAELFNTLTGFARPVGFNKLLVAPREMKEPLIALVAAEAAKARAGAPARIIAKCNAIVDRDIIRALYDASNAGVRIDLLIRGVCCLVPGVPGMSENITVRSVVGRFLEHSRVYWFGNESSAKVYIGSADLMDRNLVRRVETLVPIDSPELRAWLHDHFLARYLNDKGRTRVMGPSGGYTRAGAPGDLPDVHKQFLADLDA
ncbi:MAG: polyphosphate kinase [Myxococcota bacterium]|jgi:polyphosphate kinase